MKFQNNTRNQIPDIYALRGIYANIHKTLYDARYTIWRCKTAQNVRNVQKYLEYSRHITSYDI